MTKINIKNIKKLLTGDAFLNAQRISFTRKLVEKRVNKFAKRDRKVNHSFFLKQ